MSGVELKLAIAILIVVILAIGTIICVKYLINR
jgi:hypothetical protein